LTEHILHPPTTKRPPSPWAIALSLLLNLLFAALLIYVSWVWKKETDELARQQQQVEVDLVPQPPPQPQAQQQPPPPPPQQQQQQEKKEQEKQPEKREEEKKKEEEKKPPEKPPEKEPEKQKPQEKLAKPPPPQLLQAPLKDKSSSDRHDDHNGANGQNIAIAMGPGPMLSIRTDQDGTRGPEGSRGPIGEELSQNEQDYVLSQILPYWKVDTKRPEGHGMVLEAIIEINSDGTLMHPLGRDDPWNPNGIIGGYAEMVRLGYSYKREALEGFLLALRLSQPIKVPPGGKWPKWMKLRFAFDDL
jgi:hypothetical protein